MNSSIPCEACQVLFIPDIRQHRRQCYCGKASCQKSRRRESQRTRRARFRDPLYLGDNILHLSRGWLNTEAAMMKPHQLALKGFHPVIIGLISQFIDSPQPDDILSFIRRCYARGSDILSPRRLSTRS